MRIVHVIGYFQPEFGYEEGYTAITQHKAGHEVHIICSKYCSPFKGLTKRERWRSDNEYAGVTVHRLNSIEFYSDFIFLFGLKKLLTRLSPDIIHSHTTVQLPSIQGIFYSKKYNIPHVIDCHEFNFKGSSLNPIQWSIKSVIKYVEFRFFRLPIYRGIINWKSHSHVISVAPVCTNYLKSEFNIGNNNLSELNLSVLIDDSYVSNFKLNRSEFGWDSTDLVFLFSGIVSERKKLPNYFRVFECLPQNYKLLMVLQGETTQLEEYIINNRLENKIKIIKGVKSNDIKQYYGIADLGLWLYNNSISYLEAIAHGLPVCIVELQLTYLVPKDLIFLIPPNLNIDEITSFLSNSDFTNTNLEVMSENGKKFVKENLSYEKYVRDIDEIYGKVISGYEKK